MTTETSKNRPYTEYYQNGQKKVEGDYKDGKKNGKWTEWYENGQKWVESNYKDGKLHGKFTSWHWHGGIKSDVYYINDKVDGITKFTDYYGDFYLSWYMNGELAGTCGDDGVWEYTELGNKIMSEIMSEND